MSFVTTIKKKKKKKDNDEDVDLMEKHDWNWYIDLRTKQLLI